MSSASTQSGSSLEDDIAELMAEFDLTEAEARVVRGLNLM